MVDTPDSIIATAIHAGHDLRPDVAALIAVSDTARRHEEDPYTDELASVFAAHVVVNRSRFELDLNRPRNRAVYRSPAEAWRLEVWAEPPLPDSIVEASLAIYDSFYRDLALFLDHLAARGPFVVVDVHSYNHRRSHPEAPPEPASGNPDINLGTGSLDHSRWHRLASRFLEDLQAMLPGSTVGENVKFQGGHLSRWINERYDGAGCALAIEFKKTFVDEWTGEVDLSMLVGLQRALAATLPGLRQSLAQGT